MAELITTCPACKSKLRLEVSISESQDKYINTVYKVIYKYLFWKLYGAPKYREGQYFYDDYREEVEFIKDENANSSGTFKFRIQVFDSPEGDTWLIGSIKSYGAYLDEDTLEYKLY